jgi:hypothetical protein
MTAGPLRRYTPPVRALCNALLLLLLWAPAAHAAPSILVKGRTVLRFIGIYPGDDGPTLVGVLQDKDLGSGIPDRTVEVVLTHEGRRAILRARTDAEGKFRLTLPSGQQAYQLEARFDGDMTYAPVAPQSSAMDITKLTPEIELNIARELDMARPTHELRVVTRAEGKNISLPLELTLERGQRLDRLTTDATGAATLRLPTARLGGPGPVTLLARFAGDLELNPVTGQAETVLVTKVQLTLTAKQHAVQTDEELHLAGTVADSRGGIGNATVSLEAMGRHVTSALSDADGSFSFDLRAKDFPPGPLDLVARFTPAMIWRKAASSASVQVIILPPTPIPVRLYAIPVVITALIMLALLSIRYWPGLRRRRPQVEQEQPLAEPAPEPVASGVRLARTSLRSLVKPASDIHGVVWDPVDRGPVAGARVQIEHEGGRGTILELHTDAAGNFRAPGLAAGTHRVRVAKQGYVSERFVIQIPHRGSLHGIRVDLVQVRVRLLELYREVALALLPSEQLWARWTPRELARHVGGKRGRRDHNLESLTRMLEQAYWAADPADEGLLNNARELARSLR